jgi:hypothetical protein
MFLCTDIKSHPQTMADQAATIFRPIGHQASEYDTLAPWGATRISMRISVDEDSKYPAAGKRGNENVHWTDAQRNVNETSMVDVPSTPCKRARTSHAVFEYASTAQNNALRPTPQKNTGETSFGFTSPRDVTNPPEIRMLTPCLDIRRRLFACPAAPKIMARPDVAATKTRAPLMPDDF